MDIKSVLPILGLILLSAKIFGGIAQRIGIPSVLAELSLGIVLANLGHLLPRFSLTSFSHSPVVHGLAELGVLFLLFIVGLETNIQSMKKSGRQALLVALVGVLAPMLLVFGIVPVFMKFSFPTLLFLAATLTATSVGITVRVLQDIKKLSSPSGQIILGAAVIDDVLGILILTVVSAMVTKGSINPLDLAFLFGKVLAFVVGVVLLRIYVLKGLFLKIKPLEVSGSVTVICVSLCLLFAWLAESVGLAGILGAFALGVALDDVHFKGYEGTRQYTLEHLMKPITDFLVPIFFVVMGMGVDLSVFKNQDALILASLLTICAVLGKLVCGLVVNKRQADRLTVGFGMLPRGEVGLIFASMGLQVGVFSQTHYSATVVMVVITTLIAPWFLAKRAAYI